MCTKYSYICSLHFVGENGPTAEYPDPISAVKSAEHVSFHEQLYYVNLARYYVNIFSFIYYRAWHALY